MKSEVMWVSGSDGVGPEQYIWYEGPQLCRSWQVFEARTPALPRAN